MAIPKIIKPPNKDVIIPKLLKELKTVKKCVSEIEMKRKNNTSESVLSSLDREYEVLSYRVSVIRKKLNNASYVDPRGRPPKLDSEKYTANRSKFTAMLNSDNLAYLKKLKSNDDINNISELLDELIESYIKSQSTSKKITLR